MSSRWRCVVQTTGKTPLCMASEMGHVEVVRALLDAGATVNEAEVRRRRGCDLCGSSPLAGRARTHTFGGVLRALSVWHVSEDMLVGACVHAEHGLDPTSCGVPW